MLPNGAPTGGHGGKQQGPRPGGRYCLAWWEGSLSRDEAFIHLSRFRSPTWKMSCANSAIVGRLYLIIASSKVKTLSPI